MPGCFWRGVRPTAFGGSTLDVPNNLENRTEFDGPSNDAGSGAFPQMCLMVHIGCGTKALLNAGFDGYRTRSSHRRPWAAEMIRRALHAERPRRLETQRWKVQILSRLWTENRTKPRKIRKLPTVANRSITRWHDLTPLAGLITQRSQVQILSPLRVLESPVRRKRGRGTLRISAWGPSPQTPTVRWVRLVVRPRVSSPRQRTTRPDAVDPDVASA